MQKPSSVRILNSSGMATFQAYLNDVRSQQSPPLTDLLWREEFTEALATEVPIEEQVFTNRFAFGSYLTNLLAPFDRRAISRNAGLWSWLGLYFFNQLCPVNSEGQRDLLADEAYLLPEVYDFRSYYRHLVRTPWLTVLDHGPFARVLLMPAKANPGAPLGTRGEIIEQLASRRGLLGSPTIIQAAFQLYFDEEQEKPRRGAGGSAGGSPRRFAAVLKQFDLTYDLPAWPADALVAMLPKEFSRWRR